MSGVAPTSEGRVAAARAEIAGWVVAAAVVVGGVFALWHLLFAESVNGDVWLGRPAPVTSEQEIEVEPVRSPPPRPTVVDLSVPEPDPPTSVPGPASPVTSVGSRPSGPTPTTVDVVVPAPVDPSSSPPVPPAEVVGGPTTSEARSQATTSTTVLDDEERDAGRRRRRRRGSDDGSG